MSQSKTGDEIRYSKEILKVDLQNWVGYRMGSVFRLRGAPWHSAVSQVWLKIKCVVFLLPIKIQSINTFISDTVFSKAKLKPDLTAAPSRLTSCLLSVYSNNGLNRMFIKTQISLYCFLVARI